ncbi:MAG: lysophospholipid acyltransferase family protein [Schaedlerella sp.]|nr:lysophospholipid acyltransferase family protein [Schaedlerella sp.]
MIRFLILCLFLGSYLILSIPVFLYEYILGKFNPQKSTLSSLGFIQRGLRCMEFLAGTEVTVIGKENIPQEPVLYIGNHRSFFDIILTYSRCPGPTGFISKKEMKKAPLLSVWMKFGHCLFLDRENPREGLKTILEAIELIKNGVSIFLFPEGTRNKGAELSMLPFKDGAFKIATKSGCPIIPVSMNNTIEIFESHFPKVKKTHVIIEYGKPVYPNELSREDKKNIGSYVQNIIQETINKNASMV